MKKAAQFTNIFICALLFCLCIVSGKAEAAKMIMIEPEVEYGQTEARTMLKMINNFRTGNEAWVWNEENNKKITYSDLSELEYDYSLEQIAMQRAAEIAVSYDHTRPNNERCFTAFGNYQASAYGENIAAGYETAKEVMEGWKETEEPYLGQGHRRNMLSENFNAIGIGHAYYNGKHYWVQEFGNILSPDTEMVAANDKKTKVPIEVLSSNISKLSLKCSTETLTVSVGEKKPLPEIIVVAQIKEHWLGGNCPVYYLNSGSIDPSVYFPNSLSGNITFVSKNKKVVSVSKQGIIKAKKKGTAKIILKKGSKKAVLTVTVK